MLIWLNDRSHEATKFAKQFLLSHSGTGNDINGNPKPYTSSGLAKVYAGSPLEGHGVQDGSVETTQIAPTILKLLGLDPHALQAVQEEGAPLLPLN